MSYSLKEQMRFVIARFLDKHTSYCWSDLVSWALGRKDFRDLEKKGQCQRFGDHPYCGKCDIIE